MPTVPTWGTKLWEETATARTISMQSSEGMRDQPPPGEVGGAKLWSHFNLLRWTGQEAGGNRAILTKGSNALCHQRAGPTQRKFKELLISHITGQLCMQWEFTILSCTGSNNEPSATLINSKWWYMWSISNSHIIPFTLNSLRNTDLSVRIIFELWLFCGAVVSLLSQRSVRPGETTTRRAFNCLILTKVVYLL